MNGAGQAMAALASVGLRARHTAPAERGHACAAHFALTHLFRLVTYPATGYLGRGVGTAMTFTIAGFVAALLTVAAALTARGAHQSHGP